MKLSPLAALALAGCASLPTGTPPGAPLVDYHQHLVSPAFEPIVQLPKRDAAALIADMDRAGVRQAVVLSVGYSFADERKKLADPDTLTSRENDWTSAQVAPTRGRLIGFCSANPLREVALTELERCLRLPAMRGIKLHIGNSGVSFRDPGHIARLRQVFALAERARVPVLIHMRPRGGTDYGAADARTFIDQVLPSAPSIPVIVAHLGASSPGYAAQNDEIMAEFAMAAAEGKRRLRGLYFDVSANVTADSTPADTALIAKRMRAIGIGRFLYGSDLSVPGGSIAAGWQIFRSKLPLTTAEFQSIQRRRLAFMR